MTCLECRRGLHEECDTECEECHPATEEAEDLNLQEDPVEYKDVHSTGRKRAAMLYPIYCHNCNQPTTRIDKASGQCSCSESDKTTDPCEWRGLKNCGGGTRPIVGCIQGSQRDRHHGPLKNTLRNEIGNVHRICAECHQRWHMLNDPDYIEERASFQTHSPEPATIEELLANNIDWDTGVMKAKYNLKSNKKVLLD